MMKKERVGFVDDHISQLPEQILQRIWSFLDFRDVIRMSVLSKTWKDAVFSSLQYINVTDNYFVYPEEEDSDVLGNNIKLAVNDIKRVRVRSMLNAVDQIILRNQEQNLHVQKFSLQFGDKFVDLLGFSINEFITVLARDIQELVLHVGSFHSRLFLSLPEVAPSLEKLDLRGFKLGWPSAAFGDVIKFDSLREMNLGVTHLDDQQLQLLVMSSPQLEILNIDCCFGLSKLGLHCHYKLRKISMHLCAVEFNGIEIQEAPSLEYLSYSDGMGRLMVVDLAACKNLKFLELHGVHVDDMWIEQLFSNLNVLEEFRLGRCEKLRKFRISSNSLRRLQIEFCESLVKAHAYAPHLSKFMYFGSVLESLSLDALNMDDINFVKHDSGNLSTSLTLEALSEEDINLVEHGKASCYSPDNSWYNKLLRFLESCNHAKAIKLENFKPTELVIPSKLREKHPSLHRIKHLTVGFSTCVHKTISSDVLDSLLWLAPSLNTLSFVDGQSKKTFQFIHENSANEDCTTIFFQSWRHGIKQVKIKNSEDNAERWKLALGEVLL